MSADLIAVQAEGSWEEQIQEAVTFISRSKPESDRAPFLEAYQKSVVAQESQAPADAGKKAEVLDRVLEDVDGLGIGSPLEIEGFFNLLVSLLVASFPVDTDAGRTRLNQLVSKVSSDASPERASLKLRILTNVFNALHKTSPLRLSVYTTILEQAAQTEETEAVAANEATVDKWLAEWDVPAEEKARFLKTVSDIFDKSGKPARSYTYLLKYLAAAPSADKSDAASAIAAALRQPTVFDFEPLLKLEAVRAAKDEAAFALLKIFLDGGLEEYEAWAKDNGAVLGQLNLDGDKLSRKIRLLTLTTLCCKNVGQDLRYADIASTIKVEESAVESWVIDVIRAGLVSGKLSQTARSFRVHRAAHRMFGAEEWQALEDRLGQWKESIASILDMLKQTAVREAEVEAPAPAQAAPVENGAEAAEPAAAAAA